MTKEVLWSLSNITAGTEKHISCFLSSETILEKVFYYASKSEHLDLRREAIMVLTNLITTIERPDVLLFLASYGQPDEPGKLMKTFVTNLRLNDASTTLQILEALDVLFKLDRIRQAPLEQ